VGSRDPLLEFWASNISGTNEVRAGRNKARNFKFGTEMNGSEYLRKMQN